VTSLNPPTSLRCGIACFITNEAAYLPEWIEFHRLVGFEKFLLYDNDSVDKPEAVLEPYLESGIVIYQKWPNPHGIERFHLSQLAAYADAVESSQSQLDWLAIIDSDEFLFSPKGTPISEVLKPFLQYPGVGVNWQVFGTSGVWDLHPGECLVEKLIWKRNAAHSGNVHIKSIVQPKQVQSIASQHHCVYKNQHLAVNTDGIPIEGPYSHPPIWNHLRINHYMFRTERFFQEQKIPMMRMSGRYEKRKTVLEDEDSFRQEKDLTIHQYLPDLKKALKHPSFP
jgi:hypothetical protein